MERTKYASADERERVIVARVFSQVKMASFAG